MRSHTTRLAWPLLMLLAGSSALAGEISIRLVDAVTTRLLLKTVMTGRLKPKQLVTHHFTLDEGLKAYDTFSHAGRERTLKVILTNQPSLTG